MDEKYFSAQSQNLGPVETSKWAKIALWCVVLGYLVPIAWIIVTKFHSFTSSPYERDLGFGLTILLFLGGGILITAGLIFGVIALIHIALNRREIKGTGKAIAAIVLSLMCLGFLAISRSMADRNVKLIYANGDICEAHILELGKALKRYADEHGAYPAPDKWCDMLLQGKYVTEDIFKCPGNKKVRCSYSINPKCRPDSPSDTILIFESDSGWNSYGGPNLFSIKHHGHYGGHILSNDFIFVMWDKYDPNGWPTAYMSELRELKNKGRDSK